jgi:primosomal protein dnaI
MITLKEGLEKQNLKINNSLKVDFNKELNNPYFSLVLEKIDLEENKLYKYTSRIKDCANEEQNCQNCKGLCFCKNEMKGYKLIPNVLDNKINFEYEACSYMKKNLKETSFLNNIKLYNEPSELKNARIKDIYVDDKSRVEVIKYINDYIKNYNKDRLKALYLTGSFGSGKTYLISALFNELAKQNVTSVIVYFPEFLRTLKSSFNDIENSYNERFNHVKNAKLLLIDDIGAENLTTWGRDEILGTILQYRMQENLPTFFTSNLNMKELEEHLSITTSSSDKVKARRIIERIKYLTDEMTLIGINRRK